MVAPALSCTATDVSACDPVEVFLAMIWPANALSFIDATKLVAVATPMFGVTSVGELPKLVSLDAVTPLARADPDSVPAAAVTVIFAEPLKLTPLIARAVASAVAVLAFPTSEPVNVVAVTAVNPVNEELSVIAYGLATVPAPERVRFPLAVTWLAIVVTVAAFPVVLPDEPVTFPVTLPVSGPENDAAVIEPEQVKVP